MVNIDCFAIEDTYIYIQQENICQHNIIISLTWSDQSNFVFHSSSEISLRMFLSIVTVLFILNCARLQSSKTENYYKITLPACKVTEAALLTQNDQNILQCLMLCSNDKRYVSVSQNNKIEECIGLSSAASSCQDNSVGCNYYMKGLWS